MSDRSNIPYFALDRDQCINDQEPWLRDALMLNAVKILQYTEKTRRLQEEKL